MNALKPILTIDEAANHLEVTSDIIRDLVNTEAFPAFGIHKNLIRSADIISFVTPQQNVLYREAGNRSGSDTLCTSNILFEDYFENYLSGLSGGGISGEGISSRTLNGYLHYAQHIINDLGHYYMSEIDKSKVQMFLNNLTMKKYKKGSKQRHYSQSVINKIYDLLHGCIRVAADENNNERFFSSDFMINMKRPRSKKMRGMETQALSDAEIQRISNIVSENKMIAAWIHILLYTGVRPSEALALRFQDIDYENKTISIIRALSYKIQINDKKPKRVPIIKDLKNMTKSNGSNYQRRTLKVSDNLLDCLREWQTIVCRDKGLCTLKRRHENENLLFCGTKGQLWFYDDYKQVYERLLLKYGLDISVYNPYRFRHNYCTRALRMGKDIKTIQLMMGDNTPDMVLRIYANMNKDDILRGSADYSDHMDQILVGELVQNFKV